MDAKWEIKKGDKFVLEIEITVDGDMYEEGRDLLRSIYQEKMLCDCFRVTSLQLIPSFDTYKRRLAEAIKQAILSNSLEIKPIEDESKDSRL